jgi:catechol 2,3-dioxygenase-like lactoylglutathione lyase family enzyme
MTTIIDHVGLTVSDYERALAFYRQALAPLGISVVMQLRKEETGGAEGAGFGRGGKPSFWISPGGRITPHTHIAFAADDRAAVDAFHAAAIAAGGRDNGPPGLRPEYHPSYYGAFVLDPDGHNIEAVCHRPE